MDDEYTIVFTASDIIDAVDMELSDEDVEAIADGILYYFDVNFSAIANTAREY